jgi:hypothetical protein
MLCVVLWDAMIFCNNFARWLTKDSSNVMLPKRRFWIAERTFGNAFSKYLSKGWVLDLGYVHLKLLRKCVPKCSFGLPKSSFGEHKRVMLCVVLWDAMIFCNKFMLPKRRFWKSDERLGTRFRSAFQRGEYSIWATFLWKVARKFDPKRSFGLPKSSFGEHKVWKMIN